jgi:phosphoglycerate dehydrogenase-like enzyme
MKVLVGANVMGLEHGIPTLQQQYPDIEFVHCPVREEALQMIGDADIYMGWLNREMFLAAKKLRWIQSPSSGVNFYCDIPELVEGDVLLTSASGTHAACVADSAMAMILAFTRGIRLSILDQQERRWAPGNIRPHLMELTESTMGIVGIGAIGRAVAKRAKGFDMRVIAVDLYPTQQIETVDTLWGLDRLDDLMRESDFVVVAVPYTPHTKGMIGAAQIAQMKPTAMLVAMSRGGIVDEGALAQALRMGKVAAAAMDVFETEPLPADSELWSIDNLLITSHIAGGTQYEGRTVLKLFHTNLDRFLRNEFPLQNQVDKRRGF